VARADQPDHARGTRLRVQSGRLTGSPFFDSTPPASS
jgi:hypothetical protein